MKSTDSMGIFQCNLSLAAPTGCLSHPLSFWAMGVWKGMKKQEIQNVHYDFETLKMKL